jgi:uncharacterized protein YcaQ
VVRECGLVPVEVEGWSRDGTGTGAAWADPAALAALADPAVAGARHRTVLLSPFDSLIWDRNRAERVFGFRHRLEAYVPKPKRQYGYFAMPVLSGGRLIGRVDPAREGRVLVGRQVSFGAGAGAPERVPASAVRSVARAMREAASWVGCEEVRVERVEPPTAAGPLTQALAAG